MRCPARLPAGRLDGSEESGRAAGCAEAGWGSPGQCGVARPVGRSVWQGLPPGGRVRTLRLSWGPRAELWDVKAGGRCQPSCGWQGNGAFLLWSRPQGWAGAAHAAPRTPPPGRGISSVGGHRSPQHLEPQKGLSLGVCGLWGAGQKGEAAFLLWLHVGLWE